MGTRVFQFVWPRREARGPRGKNLVSLTYGTDRAMRLIILYGLFSFFVIQTERNWHFVRREKPSVHYFAFGTEIQNNYEVSSFFIVAAVIVWALFCWINFLTFFPLYKKQNTAVWEVRIVSYGRRTDESERAKWLSHIASHVIVLFGKNIEASLSGYI